jgi:hypothetical protein
MMKSSVSHCKAEEMSSLSEDLHAFGASHIGQAISVSRDHRWRWIDENGMMIECPLIDDT